MPSAWVLRSRTIAVRRAPKVRGYTSPGHRPAFEKPHDCSQTRAPKVPRLYQPMPSAWVLKSPTIAVRREPRRCVVIPAQAIGLDLRSPTIAVRREHRRCAVIPAQAIGLGFEHRRCAVSTSPCHRPAFEKPHDCSQTRAPKVRGYTSPSHRPGFEKPHDCSQARAPQVRGYTSQAIGLGLGKPHVFLQGCRPDLCSSACRNRCPMSSFMSFSAPRTVRPSLIFRYALRSTVTLPP